MAAAVSEALRNHLAPGYSAYEPEQQQRQQTQTATDHAGEEDQEHADSIQMNPSATNAFITANVDLTIGVANPDPADLSESFFAKYDRVYFRRLNINPKNIRVAASGKEGRLDVAIGPGQTQYEVLVRTPTLTCKWRPQIWPLGDNKVDNPQSKYGAEAHELYKSGYNLSVAPHATDSASSDAHGRNLHAVHFFNWCYTLTREVHAHICKNLPSVVTYAGNKIRDSYNAIAQQRREPFKSQEEAEAMFRENGFAAPFKCEMDKNSGTYRENSEFMKFGGNVFMKISDKMKTRYETEVPPMPGLDPLKSYAPSLYIHSLFDQRKVIDKTPGPNYGKLKEGFIFKDVPLLLLRGPTGRPHLVPFEQRKGLLTDRSVVSCLVGISFSISTKTGLLMMNTSLKRVTYCGENTQMPSDGGNLEEELAWDTTCLPALTIPPGLLLESAPPVVTDVTNQLQITADAGSKRKEPTHVTTAAAADEDNEDELSETERRQRRRTESNVH